MDKTEIRAIIKHFVKQDRKAKEIHAFFQNSLKKASPSYSTVAKWTSDFKSGRESLDDGPRSGRPKRATNPEVIAKVRNIVLEDRRMKLRDIAKRVGISYERVYHILTEELGMKKISDRWVQHKKVGKVSMLRLLKNVLDEM